MKLFLLLFITFLLTTGTNESSNQISEYRILQVGCFHGDQVETFKNSNWYALYKSTNAFSLKEVSVLSNSCHDTVLDEQGESTGVEVSITEVDDPILLVQSPKPLRAGILASAFEKQASFEPGVTESIRLNKNKNLYLYVTGEVTDEGFRHPSDLLIKNFKLVLYETKSESETQVIFKKDRVSYEGLPTLIWSGDLDSDGKIDFLLDLKYDYNMSNLTLFLSSEAEEGKYVKKVAEFYTTGC